MSTSFIYHAFGLRGYDYVRQDFIAGNIIMKVQPKDDQKNGAAQFSSPDMKYFSMPHSMCLPDKPKRFNGRTPS